MTGIIEIENLVKKFGDFTAVDRVNLSIQKGQIFGILGPNGAGKTTTINVIMGLLAPTSGTITVDGIDVKKNPGKIKDMVSLMTQETIVDEDLTAYENLDIAARLYHIPSSERHKVVMEALAEAELTDMANNKAKGFSGGMKRRLYLVKSMIFHPKVIILDEPTTGLDVQNRMQMWGHIQELQQQGVTVVITTQYLEEADQLCNRVAVIDHGKLIAIGTPSELKSMVSKGRVMEVITTAAAARSIAELLKKRFKLEAKVMDDKVSCLLEKDPVDTFKKVFDALVKEKLPITSISMHLPTLDDVFMTLTGSSIRDTVDEKAASARSNIMSSR
ncbi:daunorubicin resistance ABC transporter ATPase subunit [mine drainage metagenome]|uniref:Daunorubicin resistance ABC transporter ATPase subunit n=1 Tax=mine drainage metagenome TaxID=410659 RepID=T1ACJ0_9ZZZZ